MLLGPFALGVDPRRAGLAGVVEALLVAASRPGVLGGAGFLAVVADMSAAVVVLRVVALLCAETTARDSELVRGLLCGPKYSASSVVQR